MKALIIGPGRVGCGFAGQVLREAGFDVVFAARNPLLVRNFEHVRRYRVRLVSPGGNEEVEVRGIRATSLHDRDRVLAEASSADLIATAVTPDGLRDVAPLIAEALAGRDATNVLAFENLIDAGPLLRRLVADHSPDAARRHGFAGALVTRAVTQRIGDPSADRPLTFLGDPHRSFVVDGSGLRVPLPPIQGMVVVSDHAAWARRKLFTFSAGHAAAAYLGHLKGYRYIHTAIRDPEIRSVVLGVLHEGQEVLRRVYGSRFDRANRGLDRIIARFENAGLEDPVVRVGRHPLRKLGRDERLLAPALLAERTGVEASNFALTIAAALCFRDPADPSSLGFQQRIEDDGLDRVLDEHCGVHPGTPLARSVAEIRGRFASGCADGGLLLSLEKPTWAWDARRLEGAMGA